MARILGRARARSQCGALSCARNGFAHRRLFKTVVQFSPAHPGVPRHAVHRKGRSKRKFEAYSSRTFRTWTPRERRRQTFSTACWRLVRAKAGVLQIPETFRGHPV